MNTETPQAAIEALVSVMVEIEDFRWSVFDEVDMPAIEIMAMKARSLEIKREHASKFLAALRSLPVEQRMEEMGMEPGQGYKVLNPERYVATWREPAGPSDEGDE